MPFGKTVFRRHFRGALQLSKQRKNSIPILAALLFGVVVPFTGCEAEKGPAEKVGAAADKVGQDVKNAVTNPGPGEKAGRAVDKAVNP
jgi:hypothetical protein